MQAAIGVHQPRVEKPSGSVLVSWRQTNVGAVLVEQLEQARAPGAQRLDAPRDEPHRAHRRASVDGGRRRGAACDTAAVRVAVVGHVEWVQFARVERVPAPGEIVHARDWWEEPAGGGAVAAVQLARLAGAAELFTAFGDDELGHRAREELAGLGLRVHAVDRPEPQRRAFTFVDDDGERMITVLGRRLVPREDDPLPWERLAGVDAVYVTAGDAGAVRTARRARVLVATPRAGEETLVEAGVPLDALVGSAEDPGERLDADDLDPPPRLVVSTSGAEGGRYTGADGTEGSWEAAAPPGPVEDVYGAGDSFAAGLAYGLAEGRPVQEAVELAARCGAACLTGRGPYEGQLRLDDGRGADGGQGGGRRPRPGGAGASRT